MELTMAAQADPTPWEINLPSALSSTQEQTPSLQGRSNFSLLGLVRRKPSRPDAPPTLSKSCSDKLSSYQFLSLLSSLTSLLLSPTSVYISSLVLPSSQYSTPGIKRAFSSSGRLAALEGKNWEGGYGWKEMKVLTTDREFRYSRRFGEGMDGGGKTEYVSSNISAVWMRGGQSETLINGTLQGRKQFDTRGASMLCRRKMWRLAIDVVKAAGWIGGMAVGAEGIKKTLKGRKYKDVKGSQLLEGRRKVKEDVRKVLEGWVSNEGDDSFELDER